MFALADLGGVSLGVNSRGVCPAVLLLPCGLIGGDYPSSNFESVSLWRGRFPNKGDNGVDLSTSADLLYTGTNGVKGKGSTS